MDRYSCAAAGTVRGTHRSHPNACTVDWNRVNFMVNLRTMEPTGVGEKERSKGELHL